MPKRIEQSKGFQVPKSNRFLIRVVFGTVIATLFILAILPFTQALSGDPKDRTFREIAVANIPPPEPPPPEPPPPEEEEEEQVEEFEEPPPPLDLSQLEASLNPGTGSALMNAFNLNQFIASGRSAVDDMKIFSLRELDSRPKRKKIINPEYPIELRRQRVEGVVKARIMIDETGRVTVMEITETADGRFNQSVRDALEKWIFEPPTKDGVKVRAQYIQPIPFEL